MDIEKEKDFERLLFEKWEETLARLHVARHERYKAEVECMNLQETISYLQKRIAHEETKEKP